MDKGDIPYLSAGDLSRLIEKREVSPVEATEAYLDRIDDLDFKFNAYLTVCRDLAMDAAREAERAIAAGGHLGPMHGVPVAVKDQFWSKGIRSTGGSRILMDFVPGDDATVIANLKRAGAVLLGKTNLTEFAVTGFTHRFSTPRNPWDLDRYTGGSSGGSGAATGAFMCATSLGEDTGGSIRCPATWCGLVGHRPTWGRVSRYGVMRGVWSMDAVGPISRTVEDAAITLGAIAGHDPRDPYTWDTPVPDYRAALDGDVRGMKVGVISEIMDSEPGGARGPRGRVPGRRGPREPGGRRGGGIHTPHDRRQPRVRSPAGSRARRHPRQVGAGAAAGLRARQSHRPGRGQHHAGPGLLQGPEAQVHDQGPGPRRAGQVRRTGPSHLWQDRPRRWRTIR